MEPRYGEAPLRRGPARRRRARRLPARVARGGGRRPPAPLRPALLPAQRPSLSAPQCPHRRGQLRRGGSRSRHRTLERKRRRAPQRARGLGAGAAAMNRDLERRQEIERWIAWVRVFAVPFAVVEVGFLSHGFPPGYERWAWISTAALALGAVVIWLLARRDLSSRGQSVLGACALVFDVAIVAAFLVIFYAWEPNTPIRQVLFLPVVEGAVRFGIAGGIVVPLLFAPFLAWGETLRADRYGRDFNFDAVTFPLGLYVLVGLIVGWLAARLQREAIVADERAAEAEELRDQLGRRADQLEAVNRVSRALASSLVQDEAFDRFLRELSGVFEFERLAIVLVEGDDAVVMANSGVGAEDLYPRGTARPIAGSVLEDVARDSQTIVRGDMDTNPRYPEERELARAGLRSRVIAPLAPGGQLLGMLSVSRSEADAFSADEADLITMLARQVG